MYFISLIYMTMIASIYTIYQVLLPSSFSLFIIVVV
jgi:hypothetical protein